MVDVTPTDETAFREPDATAVRPTPPPRRDDARFTPGLLIADRFRIIAPIGRGGMGEVYRADDTKLGQQVALKFLPDASQEKLQRLYGEVRIGRQVSHPNVCRLYDAFEWEGHHFLSMEYIDGEDLASLLRRIGKLPHDKALEITRELCAGLAAAHALGVIHRDLKPANVMLDGRGRARITDFGLAAFSDDTVAVREMAGTPSYMAPEQLRGGEATHKSDLYALGLIVYELFTGRRMFEAKSVGDLISQHEQSHSRNLSQQTRDVEPNVQRVIVRCLEEKPEQRPPSIHAVIAALPGGDPLQAALDAGETPSPEMIAAAGEVGELRPAVAIGLALAVPLLLLLATLVTQRTRMYEILTLPKSPDVLIDRARDFSAARGNAHPFDRAHFWAVDPDFSRQPRGLDFRGIEPSPVSLVVRESPQSILPKRMLGGSDPPFDVAGMVTLTYDPRGRLLRYFRVLPPVVEHAKPGDWKPFFDEAGLDESAMKVVEPKWTPSVASDRRFAWEGASNGHPLRIEATTLRGHVTSFTTIAPWKNPVTNVGTTRSRTLVARFGYAFGSLLLMSTLVIAAVLARRNIRRGRGDRRGAFRVATVVFCASLAYWMLRMRHATDLPNEWNELSLQLALALFSAASVWVFYMAAEPYLRRRWPRTLIAWNRLFAGRFDDPMVGRDLLIGIVAGAVFATVHLASVLIVDALGVPIRIPWMQIWALNGLRTTLGTIAEAIEWSTGAALTLAVFVLLLQLVLRKRVVALAVAAVLVAPIITMAGNHGLIEVLVNIALAGMMMFVFARLGILALCALLATQSLLFSAALTLDPSSWYFALGLVSVAPLVLGAAWGAWTAMAKQPVFRALVLEE